MEVTILLGSSSDMPVAKKVRFKQFALLTNFFEGARSPKFVSRIHDAEADGCMVFIAGPGLGPPRAFAALPKNQSWGLGGGDRLFPPLPLFNPPGFRGNVGVAGQCGYLAAQILGTKRKACEFKQKSDQIRESSPKTARLTGALDMFDVDDFVQESIESLQNTIDDVAIIACSGGVDSTVAAVIANKAVGDLLHCVYVDTGFMRKGETEQIEALLADQGIKNLVTVKAADRYFEALKGVTEPEQKRKVIGELFIRIFEDEQKKCGAKYLVQGTIAPDWIESGGGVRDTIKSHHNVGGLPEDMTLEVVEPLRDLYKDEVRQLARHLSINVAERQPFPGPGLAVRTLGELTPERVAVVRESCAIVEEELEKAAEEGLMELPWQYFAALLPVRSVGVHGDVRAYGETVVVRAVRSMDGMSARYSEIPHSVLQKISTRITNTVKGAVNRVVYE
ncbi:MAG: hypothetical protein CM15mP2_1500 [Methanobacteriota archaeon]|nr:MAG: hypothetical protein CM15mP2_1500 [Euryarchaeota archaeon]